MTSVLTKKQVKEFRKDYTTSDGPETIIAHVRYDDECGNGHNSFAITASIYEKYVRRGEETVLHKSGQKLYLSSCGCQHEAVAKHFPELAPLLKWHLCSSDGPMHYIANTLYHAGDRDHWGLQKGEMRPSGKHVLTGEGKERDLDAARSCAIWPEATDEELTAPGLKERLEARRDKLMADFRAAVESLGFTY